MIDAAHRFVGVSIAALALAVGCAPRIDPVPAYAITDVATGRRVPLGAADSATVHALLSRQSWGGNWATIVPASTALTAPGIHLERHGDSLVGMWQGTMARHAALSGDDLRRMSGLLERFPALPAE